MSWRLLCAGVMVFLLSLPAFPAEDEPQPDEVHTLPEVLIEGQRLRLTGTGSLGLTEPSQGSSRLGLTVREIPASIEIISQQTVQERGLRTVSEAMQAAIGVTVGDHPVSPGAFSMRGFSGNQIRLLFDGLSLGPTGFVTRPRDSWNLDRIEILKGPASVLYGEGAVAGMINLVTKRPDRKVEGSEVSVSYGSYNTVRAGLGSGGTLGSKSLHYRIDGSYQSADSLMGVQRTPYALYNLTSALLYDVSSDFHVELSFDVAYDQSNPYWGTPLVPKSFSTDQVNGVVDTADHRTIDHRMLRKNYNVQDGNMSALTTWTKLKMAWQPLEWVNVRNQSFYYTASREWKNAETYSFDPGTELIDRDRFLVEHDQWVVGDRFELQVNHPIGDFQNRFVSGIEFNHINFTRPSYYAGNVDSVDPFSPVQGVFDGGSTAKQIARVTNTAFFAEDQFSVLETLKIVAGIRYDLIHLERKRYNTLGVLNPATSFTENFDPLTWRVGVVYDVIPQMTLYGQYATAADPVAGSLFTLSPGQRFDLARGEQWEVGIKGQFWDDRIQWTVAYFDIRRKHILTQVSQNESVNVGKQSSKGVEIDLAAKVTDAWRVQGNVTFLSAKFDKFSQLSGGNLVSRNGHRPPEVPQTVANLWSVYRLPVTVPVDVGAAWRYVGDRYNDTANTIRLRSYMTVDAWLSVAYKQFWMTFRTRNLFDQTYAIWGSQFYPEQVLIGAPRTYELSVTARF
ncbi:MAG: TonB-dependent receptor [Nitrospirales bacterium]|nr:TonB-dependent receptor [Nitrospirales bacterium]